MDKIVTEGLGVVGVVFVIDNTSAVYHDLEYIISYWVFFKW